MRSDIANPNIPEMGVEKMVESLSGLYVGAIRGGMAFGDLPSVMLWGPPGVGKSQGVRQVARAISDATGRRVDVTDVRLLLYNPIDLRGLPVANENKTLAVWLRPKVFDMDPSDDVVNVLLLDEISAAPPSIQAAAYQITLDHTCGEHELPANCIVVAAGNRVSDRSTAYRMPKSLANRLLHIEVRPEIDSWRNWAVAQGVNALVMGYLAFRPDRLMEFDAAAEDLAFPSPRSWAMVGSVLDSAGGDVDTAYPLICGLVGIGAASEFRTWSHVYGKLPKIEDIFAGTETRVPKDADALYALTSAMAVYAKAHLADTVAIDHSIAYAQRLPPDFSVMLLKDYLHLAPGCRETLMRNPRFSRWAADKGGFLNGSV